MMLLTFLILIIVLSIVEFKSHCNELPYRFYKLTNQQLNELNVEIIIQRKGKLSIESQYRFKGVELHVYKQRFTPLNTFGQICVHKNGKQVCLYSQLPPAFKSSIYSAYLGIRYPRTFAKIIYYTSTNKKTNFYDFCLKEDLLSYPGGSYENKIDEKFNKS